MKFFVLKCNEKSIIIIKYSQLQSIHIKFRAIFYFFNDLDNLKII